jgi:hypothetical protein
LLVPITTQILGPISKFMFFPLTTMVQLLAVLLVGSVVISYSIVVLYFWNVFFFLFLF